MKKPLAAILLMIFAFQVVYPAAFTAWFFANQKAIAARYCVNKARPMLHCDGKCFLAQKLRAAEDKRNGSENAPLRNMWVEIQPCIMQETCLAQVNGSLLSAAFPLFKDNAYKSTCIKSLFRPPARFVG